MSMKILLTGGTGYIGSTVLDRLIAADHQVTAIVRSQKSSLQVTDAGATAVIGDLYDAQWLASELAQHEAAIHTAAPDDGTAPKLDDTVIDAVIEAFSGTDKPYLHTGGIWTYGHNPAIHETGPIAPAAISEWRTEREARLLDSDVRATVIQPALVYGHGQGLVNTLTGGPRQPDGALTLIGSGDQHWTTVHVDDVADLYVLALDAKGGETYIAASGDNPTVRELAETVSDSVVAESTEAARERLGAGFADALLLDQQASGAKARQDLGWDPKSPSLVEELRAS
jgi:nucleoside-diphosphate-sugar epimerase